VTSNSVYYAGAADLTFTNADVIKGGMYHWLKMPLDTECLFDNQGTRGGSPAGTDKSFMLYDTRNNIEYLVWKEVGDVAAGTFVVDDWTCYPKAVGNIEWVSYLWKAQDGDATFHTVKLAALTAAVTKQIDKPSIYKTGGNVV
jgi:hypothetical protein